ncbi:hypothetical protein BCR44DRAFT_1520842 [Catenaria anguillulae PL171]|uniref:Uncharacterized protein n=1 Tax=Catenaria anguillulae PL171 TaxID=765915 RepID=A0A1Y2H259_9FUNG|nr:hypothetical protein BCR44DRAFT_1520842 [Catenaria anguillulae PL171]
MIFPLTHSNGTPSLRQPTPMSYVMATAANSLLAISLPAPALPLVFGAGLRSYYSTQYLIPGMEVSTIALTWRLVDGLVGLHGGAISAYS